VDEVKQTGREERSTTHGEGETQVELPLARHITANRGRPKVRNLILAGEESLGGNRGKKGRMRIIKKHGRKRGT